MVKASPARGINVRGLTDLRRLPETGFLRAGSTFTWAVSRLRLQAVKTLESAFVVHSEASKTQENHYRGHTIRHFGDDGTFRDTLVAVLSVAFQKKPIPETSCTHEQDRRKVPRCEMGSVLGILGLNKMLLPTSRTQRASEFVMVW